MSPGNSSHSSSGANNLKPTSPRRARAPARSKLLRNGTWVIPSTGERTRRQFTLRQPNFDGPDDDDHIRPLDEGHTLADKARNIFHNLKVILRRIWAWTRSPKGKGTIKCSIAYLLASMGTLWHPAASFLGPMDGKHIVATIVTYFHPARTAGSQMEAVAISIIAVCYAMIIGMLSMATSVLFGDVLESEEIAYAIILILFIGFGLGFIGWVKQRLNNPLVSVGASIASIGIITIITKEGSVHNSVFTTEKVVQYLKILMLATVISTVVNLVLWPVSARHGLRRSMRTASISLGRMLSLIASGFLTGAEEDFSSKPFKDAQATYTSTLAQMNKNARESKYEYYLLGQEQMYRHDKAVLKSIENLAQSVGGLRSAANTQFELLKEVSNGASSGSIPLSPQTNQFSPVFGRSFSSSSKNVGRFSNLSSIYEAPDERSDSEDGTSMPKTQREPSFEVPPMHSAFAPKAPSEIFELFIALLGPSMKSLVYTMAEMLKEPPYGPPGTPIELNTHFKDSLSDAISLYNQSRGRALEELYKKIEISRSTTEAVQADFEEVAAACGHFSFSLLSFADEMKKYLDGLEDLKFVCDQKRRTWHWLKFWQHFSSLWRSTKVDEDAENQALIQPIKRMRQSKLPQGIPNAIKHRRLDTSPPPDGLWSSIIRMPSRVLLSCGRFFARDDIRFGLKVGIGATLYAMFAFIPETMEVYRHWRGEWGLLSFMIVCSMTVGASNATGFARFMGTIVGAAFVVINWLISDGNPVGLALLGWVVSFGAFYIMVARDNGPMGRFILLSYNVSALYAYSLSQSVEDDDDDEGGIHPKIREIAFHRVVAVAIGILWALIICRLIYPMPARQKFKEGLAVLYLQMGLIWRRGPLAILLRNDAAATSYMKIGEQAAMQRYAAQLQTLRVAAKNEYELRPFPSEAYGRIMASTQRLLDAFHAMSLVTQKHGRLSEGETALLNHTASERAELCARICHVFQVLASGMMLEYPLTDAVPGVFAIRDRLLGKIFRFRQEHTAKNPLTAPPAQLTSSVSAPPVPSSSAPTLEDEFMSGGGKGNENDHEHRNDNVNGEEAAPTSNATATATAALIGGLGAGVGASSAMFGAMGSVPELGDVTLEEPDYALLYAYALVTGQVAKELKVVEEEIEGLFGRLDEDALLLQ